jgi:hypothetical protein
MIKKIERAEAINKLIAMIGSKGRRFFHDQDTLSLSYFTFRGKKKRLWFVDKAGASLSPYESNLRNDHGFSEGGTLWSLIHDMREFILTGEAANGNHGYRGLLSDGWGYPKGEMQEIISYAKEIGFVGERS